MTKIFYTIIGVIIGIIYYNNMKDSIKDPYKNCSFVANKMTDYLAFLVGGILFHYGYNIYNNNLLILLGIAITTEHILQYSYK